MKKKKILALMMAVSMAGSLAACGGGDSSKGTSKGGASEGSTEDGMVELTYMHKLNGTEKYVGDDDINNNVWTRCYQDDLGIKLNYTIAAAGDDYT